ncbi:unnamed protein product [Ostreobium quekettii]|uniref:Uncharacterized protein n=1 Tax=Ostreobium quekettii TaxID=121088 RepID=A0A8S1J0E7_9CHLO|nr:unnamed protein product [Ostreobium quekettii]
MVDGVVADPERAIVGHMGLLPSLSARDDGITTRLDPMAVICWRRSPVAVLFLAGRTMGEACEGLSQIQWPSPCSSATLRTSPFMATVWGQSADRCKKMIGLLTQHRLPSHESIAASTMCRQGRQRRIH